MNKHILSLDKTLRKIKLDIYFNRLKVEQKLDKLFNFFYFINRKDRIAKWLLDNGAILTGSRVLEITYINGSKLLQRYSSDYDFIINKDILQDFIDRYYDDISTDIGKDPKYVKIGSHNMLYYDNYTGERHITGYYIDLIVDDDLYKKKFKKDSKIQIDDIFSIYSIKNQRDLFRESKHIGDILDLCDVLNTVHITK